MYQQAPLSTLGFLQQNAFRFQNLLKLVKEAGTETSTENPIPKGSTLFAPTDEAFIRLSDVNMRRMQAMSAWDLLSNHIAPHNIYTVDVRGTRVRIPVLNRRNVEGIVAEGRGVDVRLDQGVTGNMYAFITEPDICTNDGVVIQVISGVLVPIFGTEPC